MSQENIEQLLWPYELTNTRFAELKGGDFDDYLAFFDPEVVIEMVDAPDPETYHGHDGVRSWFNSTFGPWAAIHMEAEDIRESGRWTVALVHTSLRGETSGVELELSTAPSISFAAAGLCTTAYIWIVMRVSELSPSRK